MAKIAFLSVCLLLIAASCSRYDSSPDPSWKDRNEYCYSFTHEFSSSGLFSHSPETIKGWSDQVSFEEGVFIAANARISKGAILSRRDQFHRKIILPIGEGSLTVNTYCNDEQSMPGT